jgi:YbbR domain-containing protein
MLAAFTQRLGLKATAVFLALVLWFVVNAKEPQIELVPVRFTPVLDSSLVLRGQVPQLQAIIAGAPNQLIKLSSNAPVIRRQITADAPDTLVLDLRPEDVTLPEGVDAVVQDVQPRSLTLRFESTWSRKVPVRSNIDIVPTIAPDQGPLGTKIDPESVQVNGPRHVVLGIAAVWTVKTALPYPDSLPHLIDLDTTSLGEGVRVRPSQVKVQVTTMAAMTKPPKPRGRR